MKCPQCNESFSKTEYQENDNACPNCGYSEDDTNEDDIFTEIGVDDDDDFEDDEDDEEDS